MADGTATISEVQQLGSWPWSSGLRAVRARVEFDGDNPAAGFPIDKAVFGFRHLRALFVPAHNSATNEFDWVTLNGASSNMPAYFGYSIGLDGPAEDPKIVLGKNGMSYAPESGGTDVSGFHFIGIFVGEV